MTEMDKQVMIKVAIVLGSALVGGVAAWFGIKLIIPPLPPSP